jgi:hypothetical protein
VNIRCGSGEVVSAFGEITIVVPREHLVAAVFVPENVEDTRFDFLSDICGADRGPEEEPRSKSTITCSRRRSTTGCD